MSLLQHDTPEEIDDAALGEEFTKGTSHVVWASLVAAVLVTAVLAIYVWSGQKPPLASGEIVQVWAHPQHTETSGFDANGAAMAKESSDKLMVFARVRLHNQSKEPLFLHNVLTNAKMIDGIHSSYAASASDYNRIFIAFPQLSSLRETALATETTIEPGQTVEGDIFSAFSMTKEQWDARKDLSFTFAFRYQPSLVLAPHTPVIEQ
jgi:hypothetical protein